MFRFIKETFLTELAFLSSLVSTTLLSCISMNNQACKVRPEIININSNEPVFYFLVLKQVNVVIAVIILMIHMQKICVPDDVKNLIVNVFNLMSRTKYKTYKMRYIK